MLKTASDYFFAIVYGWSSVYEESYYLVRIVSSSDHEKGAVDRDSSDYVFLDENIVSKLSFLWSFQGRGRYRPDTSLNEEELIKKLGDSGLIRNQEVLKTLGIDDHVETDFFGG